MENLKDQIKYRGFWIEFRAMLSNEPSYFSLKRWERFESYHAAILCHVGFIIWNFTVLAPLELLMLVTPLYLMAGYNLSKTEKEKKTEKSNENQPG